jgi:hypothetical protein
MPYQFYLVTHLVGIFLMLLALGGATLHMANGGTREFGARKFIGMLHGIGLLIALIGGFGLLARLRIFSPMPPWVLMKIGIWVILGVMPVLIYRQARAAKALLFGVLVLAGLSAWFAVYKPNLWHSTAQVTPSQVPAEVPPPPTEAQPETE